MNLTPSTIEIIDDKNSWKQLLEDIGEYDFYHTFDYHYLSKSEAERPILVKYENQGRIIGLPLLIRKIYDTEYYDATSVYGYGGPISKNIDSTFDNNKFKEALNDFFLENNIISVFSRLNPFIKNQTAILNNIGEVITLSQVVNIDITEDLDTQRTIFSRATKRYINKGRKLCSVRIGSSKEDMIQFKELYHENMDRVNAKESYYFDEEYFNNFINSEDFKTDVLFAINNETNEIISAAMMVKTNEIVQYHISGTKNDYLHLTPIRLLIDEMRIRATNENYKYFNLGGGLGSQEDSLFNFKSSFSKDFKNFKIWKHIINEEIYNQLSKKYTKQDFDPNYFPKYRNN